MQYGRTLDHIIRKVVIADPDLGTVYVLKSDARNRFYCIGLIPMDAPKIGLVFTSDVSGEELVEIPLNLPIEWNNSPPIF